MKFLAAAFWVTLMASQAVAQSEPSFGAGVMASRCSDLTAAIPERTDPGTHALAFSMLSWTEGYITATNLELEGKGEDGFDMNSRTAMEIWSTIYGYCVRNPGEIAVGAAIEAMTTLARRPFY